MIIVRTLIPTVAALLFLIEPQFAFLSPIDIKGHEYFVIPRFSIVYLIFIATFYARKRAVLYALFFGVLYDVFYIDIIGLYAFIYPVITYVGGTLVHYIRPSVTVTAVFSILLVAVMEFALYEFYYFIQFTNISINSFLLYRLLPTIVANLLFIIPLAIIFRLLLNARVLQRAQESL